MRTDASGEDAGRFMPRPRERMDAASVELEPQAIDSGQTTVVRDEVEAHGLVVGWEDQRSYVCTTDMDCADGERCLTPIVGEASICGVPCEGDSDCGSGQKCLERQGGEPACVHVVENGQYCGIAYRSLCQPWHTCLLIDEIDRTGFCIQPCLPEIEDLDAGSAFDELKCPENTSCLLWLETADGEPAGLCGNAIPRHGTCNDHPGDAILCDWSTDICAPDTDWEGRWTCRERCDALRQRCSSGLCSAFAESADRVYSACY